MILHLMHFDFHLISTLIILRKNRLFGRFDIERCACPTMSCMLQKSVTSCRGRYVRFFTGDFFNDTFLPDTIYLTYSNQNKKKDLTDSLLNL